MSEDDKEVFKKGRPFVVGIVALLAVVVGRPMKAEEAFEAAEAFVAEFERRNGI